MPIFKGKFVYTYLLRKLIANKKERDKGSKMGIDELSTGCIHV